jgi:hypothetical protein
VFALCLAGNILWAEWVRLVQYVWKIEAYTESACAPASAEQTLTHVITLLPMCGHVWQDMWLSSFETWVLRMFLWLGDRLKTPRAICPDLDDRNFQGWPDTYVSIGEMPGLP